MAAEYCVLSLIASLGLSLAKIQFGELRWLTLCANPPSYSQVEVQCPTPDEQLVTVSTDRPGRILLHWGVEGGQGFKGGWRLPDKESRPDVSRPAC